MLNLEITESGTREIACRSRGTPRIANRLLRRVRDYADVLNNGEISEEIAKTSLSKLDIDERGLDFIDRRYIRTIIDKFNGGPVGVETIAAILGEDKETIEDVLEPYLMQEGFIQRTPRGRVVTSAAYEYFGEEFPKDKE